MAQQPLHRIVRMTHNQWYALFDPVHTAEGTLLEIEFDDTERQKVLVHERRLWTENHYNDIANGYHFVNRLRYLETRVPYPQNIHIEVTEEGDSPHPIYFAVEKYDRFQLRTDHSGLPYIFWSIRDAEEWFIENDDTNMADYVLINQEGQRYNFDGEELGND
jgi:hypothetical protein